MEKNHIEWIDYAKVVAIFSVVWLHTHCDAMVDRYINAFVMPAFFFMSGYLFSYDANPDYRSFAAKRFRQLAVPYLWINIIAYFCWLFVLRHYGADAADDIDWSYPLSGILTGVPTMLVHDIPLWSLLSFFIVEMIYYPLGRTVLPAWAVAVGFAVGGLALASVEGGAQFPLALGPSVMGVAFYAAGHWSRGYGAVKWFSNSLILTVAVIGFAIVAGCNDTVEFYICSFGNYPMFLLGASLGIVVLCGSMTLIADAVKIEPSVIRLAAWGTLLICGFHLLVFAVIKGVALFGFGLAPEALTDGLWRGLVFAAVAFLTTLVLVKIVRSHFGWLVGKQWRQSSSSLKS